MIKRNLNFASTTLELPEYVECLTQTQIDDIRKKSNINEKIVGIGVHPVDKNISLVVATGEVKIFNAAEFYIPEGRYIPQPDGNTVYLPNELGRWSSHTDGFIVQAKWLIENSKSSLSNAELFLNNKSLGKFKFDSIVETNNT